MDQQIIERVADAYESGATANELAARLLAEYDADGCARLVALGDRLCASPDFTGRGATLRDIVEARISAIRKARQGDEAA